MKKLKYKCQIDKEFILKQLDLTQNRWQLFLFVLVICLTVNIVPINLAAQDLAIGSADALVLSVISISSSQDLTFGNVQQGVPKTILADNASAAILRISGANQAGINLRLQLPTYMTHTLGSDRLTIQFGPLSVSVDTTAAGDPTDPGISGWLNTNPYSLPSAAIIGSSGTDIYLGGEVVPTSLQVSGTYEAEIILTVAYNGQ